jgi:hypothetical protein
MSQPIRISVYIRWRYCSLLQLSRPNTNLQLNVICQYLQDLMLMLDSCTYSCRIAHLALSNTHSLTHSIALRSINILYYIKRKHKNYLFLRRREATNTYFIAFDLNQQRLEPAYNYTTDVAKNSQLLKLHL